MPVTKPSPPVHDIWGAYFGKKIILTLIGILLAYAIVLVGTMIRNNLQQYNFIGRANRAERSMSVQAEGKVAVKPDIAVTTMGVISDAPTVAEAQSKNTEVMNSLISKLQALQIEDKDIQTTNYNIFPQYNYTQTKGRELTGYEVSQSVTVKIRDLKKANQVIALAGDVGVNSVSGLQFTVDNPEVYKATARDLALVKVAAKVKSLASALGVRFVSIVSYDESGGEMNPVRVLYAGSGGEGGPAPSIEAGSNEVTVHVNVTFEIR